MPKKWTNFIRIRHASIRMSLNNLYTFTKYSGINPENVKKYLEYDRIFACGGSWMVKGKLIAEGRFDEIEKLTREAAEIVKNIRG